MEQVVLGDILGLLGLFLGSSGGPRGTGTISDDEAFQSFRKAVFISYRGKLSPFVVRSIFGNLTNHGYDVFMDVERIDSGNFETIGMDAIAGRSLWRASAPSAP